MTKPAVLAISERPRRFSGLIGQDDLVKQIRALEAASAVRVWLLYGETGSGKTTTARIMATSLSCRSRHARAFGEPCDKCVRTVAKAQGFGNTWSDIHEFNCAQPGAFSKMDNLLDEARHHPFGGNDYRVLILEEAHRLSRGAQSTLLPILEDEHIQHTVWILCTTQLEALLPEIRRRCIKIATKALDERGIKALIDRVGPKTGLSRKALAEFSALAWDKRVRSPGLILNALELHAAGIPAKDAMHQQR